jgi:hypothetical protein
MIFGHSLVLHAGELNLKPPCKEELWAAGSALEWQRALQRQKPDEGDMGFIDMLKIYMQNPSIAKEKVSMDPYGSFIVLHGLTSISWHLGQRSVGALGEHCLR